MNQYGIREVVSSWFSSYLRNRSQYVSINGFNSKLEHIHWGVPQGSIVRSLLSFTYVNDLNCAIRCCLVHHFADDTNLLNYINSVKRMNKQTNQDLKHLTNWLNANKIWLNASKTEDALFKLSIKFTDIPLKLKLNGERLYPANSLKYLGINIDENLNWKQQIYDIAIKLNNANDILSK